MESLCPDTTQIDLIRERLGLGDLGEAGRLAELCLQRAGKDENSKEIWSLRLMKGSLLSQYGRNEEALEYLASQEFRVAPDKECEISLARHKGYFLGLLGRYNSAYAILGQAERMAEDAALPGLLCQIHQSRALLLYFQEDYSSSESLFRKILQISQEIDGWYYPAVARWGIGKCRMIQTYYEEAIPWLEESLRAFEAAEAKLWMATVWSELAVCRLGLGEDQNSLDLLEAAVKVHGEAGVKQSYLVGLANIGNVYLHRCDYLRAIDYYRKALEMAREINDPVSIRKWSYNIRLAYARLCRSIEQSNTVHA